MNISYPIVTSNSLEALQKFLLENYSDQKFFVLVDENTEHHCLPLFDWGGVEALKDAEILLIDSGEINKNIEIVYQLWMSLLENHAERKSVVLNLGGGVIGDMGGFVAATYKRGIDFIQVPTTLLSMVDASVGGKLGIDIEGQKNMVGLFQNPKAVFIHTEFLETLDRRNILSGYAEVLKHALIADHQYWNDLATFDIDENSGWETVIETSIEIKKTIVAADFKETGKRKILNFGHTVGHAIETLFLNTESSLLHGEAVAAGILIESWLSSNHFLVLKGQLEEIEARITSLYALPVIPETYWDHLIDLMRNDKKNEEGNVQFVLLEEIGKSSVGHVLDVALIKESFSYYNQLISGNN